MEDGGSNLCMECDVTLPDAYRCCLDRSSGQPHGQCLQNRPQRFQYCIVNKGSHESSDMSSYAL